MSQIHQSKHTLREWGQRARWASLCVSLCASITLTACANLGGRKPEEQVRQRVAERWEALVAGDFARAYNYSTPGFKALVTPQSYRSRFGIGGTWLGGEAVSVNCPEATKCIARVRIDFKPLLAIGFGDKISTHTDETWLFEGGQWWLFQPIKGN